jgi:hypothetical protein
VPLVRRGDLPALLEFLTCVLADRLEHPVAPRPVRGGAHRHQRLLQQAPEHLEDILLLDLTERADLLRGLEREPAREHRQAPE